MKNGNINTDKGKLKTVIVNAKAISSVKMKIIIIAKTLLASVKIAPLSKNSCNFDKYFSGTLLSKNTDKSLINLNFIE
jgi:hypothetical protein